MAPVQVFNSDLDQKPPNCLLSVQSSNNLLLCRVQMSQSLNLCAGAPQPRESHLNNLQYDIIRFDHWPWAHNCGWEVKHQSSRQFHTPLTLTYEHNKEGLDTLEPLHSHQTRRGEFTVFQEVLLELTYFKSLLFIQGISVFISFRLWVEIFWTHQFHPLVKSSSVCMPMCFPHVDFTQVYHVDRFKHF